MRITKDITPVLLHPLLTARLERERQSSPFYKLGHTFVALVAWILCLAILSLGLVACFAP
jgi:hypothetical protein